jgi:hypothetical protein
MKNNQQRRSETSEILVINGKFTVRGILAKKYRRPIVSFDSCSKSMN